MSRILAASMLFLLSWVSAAQTVELAAPRSSWSDADFSDIVVPITDVKPHLGVELLRGPAPKVGLQASFGTGFCFDSECRFIVTNYHVAALARIRKIEGDSVVAQYLDDGSEDHSATLNLVDGHPMVYSRKHDLALLALRQPLRHHHGLAYRLDDLDVGEPVDIYAYPLEGINPRRKLLQFPATFRGPTASGLLAFSYGPSSDQRVVGGASGGIVVDRKSCKIVGVLSEAVGTGTPVALAVPIPALLQFIARIQPFLAWRTFPASRDVAPSPFIGDLYPEFVPSHVAVIQRRSPESEEITLLRKKAQTAADAMRNFIAIGTYDWGRDNHPAEIVGEEYELRVIDGTQWFRRYPDGKKEFQEIPGGHYVGSGTVTSGSEWADLLALVGTEYRLKIRRAPDAAVGGRKVRVFQYYAGTEDALCAFRPVDDYYFFIRRSTTFPPCYGEVWTDDGENILRMSENFDLSAGLRDYKGWKSTQAVITYGWLQKAGDALRLVPWTYLAQASDGKHVYWNRGFYRDYREFTSKAKLLAAN